jgi:hypothetical protein
MNETEILQALEVIENFLNDFNLYLDIIEQEAEMPVAA